MNAVESISKLKSIYNMLADEKSKSIWWNRFNWILTGDYDRFIGDMVKISHPNMPLMKRGGVISLLKRFPKDKKVVIYGAGANARSCIRYFSKHKNFMGICDRDKSKQTVGLHGINVFDPQELLEKYSDAMICISTSQYADEIRSFLVENHIPPEHVIYLPSYLAQGTSDQYFDLEFIHFNEHEVFVDAGCCDLKTTIKLSRKVSFLDKVFAFEPDPKNFQRCVDRKAQENMSQVEIYPFGTWSKKTDLHFLAKGSGGSCVTEKGDIVIKTISIDEVVKNEKVSFIKMDVEGAELESLIGAKKTIVSNHPKLAICIYHKPEDIIDIPLYIKSLVPEYNLYIRHHANTTIETVLYAIP